MPQLLRTACQDTSLSQMPKRSGDAGCSKLRFFRSLWEWFCGSGGGGGGNHLVLVLVMEVMLLLAAKFVVVCGGLE